MKRNESCKRVGVRRGSQKAVEKIGGVRAGRRDKVVPRGIVESFVYEIRKSADYADYAEEKKSEPEKSREYRQD